MPCKWARFSEVQLLLGVKALPISSRVGRVSHAETIMIIGKGIGDMNTGQGCQNTLQTAKI